MQNTRLVTLFLVEDDDIDAECIRRNLLKNRIANPIIRAIDGQDALDKLHRGEIPKPYVILLDLQMPRINGIDFLKLLRADKTLHDAVVFILTSSADDEDIARSYEQHIAGYFVKDESGDGFASVFEVLDGYWKIAHLPE